MDAVLIALYVLTNIIIIIVFYKKDLGVFQAPFLVACVSLTVVLPQLTTIYFSPIYDNELLYKLCYVMITCNVAFAVGFNIASSKGPPKTVRTLNVGKIQYITLFFSIIGFSTIFFYGNLDNSGAVDSVIAANLKIFASVGLSLSLITLLQGHRKPINYAALLFAMIPLINYAFLIKGSRTDSLILFLNFFLFFSLAIPKKRKFFKLIVLSFLLLGSILSASISGMRKILKNEQATEGNFSQLSYWDTFSQSFINSTTEVGMDLGNAALGIEYCYQNSAYDYGLQVWNGFVFVYVPKRIVGEKIKESLYYDTGYQLIIPKLTNNITTMTGYFFAFAAFSFFGFIFFGAIGFFYGTIWNWASYSDFYRFLYFFVFTMVAAMITHGLQLFFLNLEFSLLFIYPILSFFIEKRKLLKKSNL